VGLIDRPTIQTKLEESLRGVVATQEGRGTPYQSVR